MTAPTLTGSTMLNAELHAARARIAELERDGPTEDFDPNARRRWVRVPIIEPLMIAHCWEHTPLDYYRYGEYPRFLRPVGEHQPRWEWRFLAAHQEPTP